MSAIEVKVPDIGDFKNVPVIEINVKPGDIIKADDPLIVLESDKASMEVPAPQGGKVLELKLKVGDKVAEGSAILTLEAEAAGTAVPRPPRRRRRWPAKPRPRLLNKSRRPPCWRRTGSPVLRRSSVRAGRSPISAMSSPRPPCAASRASWNST